MTATDAELQRAIEAHQSGDLSTAIHGYRCVIENDSLQAKAWHLLGVALHQQGEHTAAGEHIRRAIELCGTNAAYYCNYGTALLAAGQTTEACRQLERSLELEPARAEFHFNYANCLKQSGQLDRAVASYRQALQLRPAYPQTQNNLGNALMEQGLLDEAACCFRSALASQPTFADAHHNLGNTLLRQERHDEAQPHFAAAAKFAPRRPEFLQSYFLSLSYEVDVDAQQRFELHRLWGAQIDGLHPTEAAFANTAIADRRLQIGYVSADFREHAVADFLEPILKNHDPTRCQVTCYANVANPDQRTEQLRGSGGQWRSIAELTDVQAAELIRSDGIDILVDLGGHTAGNRLGIFARKPAPIQVTGIGYGWTTGLPSMDYRLTDAIADPPGEPRRHTEELVSIPHGMLCFQPPTTAPDVTPLPGSNDGTITFGGFHRHVKLNERTMKLWARILMRVPGSRLMLKDRAFRHAHVLQRTQNLCDACGIPREHVLWETGSDSRRDHLAMYGKVDIALDTWPYNGSTTTCEALWMGVPVVTLAGDSYVGRMSASLLTQVGLSELIAQTEDEYVDCAVRLAGDFARLQRLRGDLRDVMRLSPLCDGPGYTRALEASYREMWRRWCDARHSARRAS